MSDSGLPKKSHVPDPHPKAASASILHNPRFRVLLTSVGLGAVSSGILSVATDLVAIYELGASATEIGLLNAAASICFLVFGIPAGLLVDRLDRVKVMMTASLAGGLAIASVPVTWFLDLLIFPQLLAASFTVGLSAMVFGIASGSALPGMVTKDFLAAAFSRQQTVESAAEVVMPSVTGVLVSLIAAPFTLILAAAASVVSSLTLLFGLRGKELIEEFDPAGHRTPLRQSIREGLAFTLRTRPVLLLIASSMLLNIGLALGSAVESVYYVTYLNFDPAFIGLVFSLAAVGGLTGSFITPQAVKRWGERSSLIAVVTILPLFVMLMPLAGGFRSAAGLLVAVHTLGYGALVVAYNALAFAMLARLTPRDMMGRQQGFRIVITMGPVPFAGIAAGLLGDAWGLQQVLWLWVGVSIFVAIPVLMHRNSKHDP